jgi:hypothetical protein
MYIIIATQIVHIKAQSVYQTIKQKLLKEKYVQATNIIFESVWLLLLYSTQNNYNTVF